MNTFNEDEYAYKIHFSNNFDCDSDSDNKSDFDDWYYKHKPPPAEIYDCDIVKIEPFTTVLYKKSISKVSSIVNANSKKKNKSKRSSGRATKNVSDLNRKTQVFPESNKPKREGTTLTNLSGYQENKPDEIPKKKRNRKKKSQVNRAELFDLSSIEWPTLGSVRSPLESKSDSIKKKVNSSFQYNNKDTKVLTELSQKCDNNVPSETKRFISESLKNINGKSITETRFLLLDEYEKQSFLKFPERLQNTPKLNNANENKVTYNSKENVQNTHKSKSQAKELPRFGNGKISIAPNKNSKMKCKKSVKATKQPDHGALKRAAFNLSSFEWPSLHSMTSSFTYKNNPQQISKNMELEKGHQTNTLRESQSAHLFKDQINYSSIPAELPQKQQQSKKKLKSQKSKPVSDNAICSITNKFSVKGKHNKHGSLQLNEQMKGNISQSYCNTNATGFLGLESPNGFWCLDNEKNSIFTRNQFCCKSSGKQSHKMLKSNHSCVHNEKLSSCSSKNIEKPKQLKVSTKINIQSIIKNGGSLNLASNEETLVQSEALQSRNGLFINTSESSMGGLRNAKSNEVACRLSLLKSEKKDKPIDTSVNKEKPKKNKAPKQFATNSSPPDKTSGSVSLDKNHNRILCNSTGCNEAEQFEKVNRSISSTGKNSHLLNNVQPKENLATDTVVNGVQLTKRKKKKPNQISEFNLSPYDESEVSELKQIKQKKTENGLELNNSVYTKKILKIHTQPKEEKASTVNAEILHSEKQSKKGLSKCVSTTDKKDEGSKSYDKEYTCISKFKHRSKKQPNENAIKSSKKEDKDPLWPRGFLLPLFKQKSKKLTNQSVRAITSPSSSNQHTDDIIFSKNGKMVFDNDFKGTLEDRRLDSVIPLNTFVTGGKDFFLIDKLFLRSPFLICAKPRLGMCNVLLHFYTGYQNDKENIFDNIMSIDDYLIDTFVI